MLELQWGKEGSATFLPEERQTRALAGLQLEKICGRAALLAGDVEGYAGACLGLGFDGGVADDPGKDEGRSVEGQITVPGGCDNRWVGGAVLRGRREIDSCGIGWTRYSRAVMCAVPSAACRQICVGAGREGQQRRDQRKAEEEKQREAEYTSHTVIVAMFVSRCVSEMLFCVGGRAGYKLGERVETRESPELRHVLS